MTRSPPLQRSLLHVLVGITAAFAVATRSATAQTAIAVGGGSVVAWGDNSYGQCDVPALPSGLTFVDVAAGVGHSVALRSDGSVVAWGANYSGECNVPSLPSGLTYVDVAAGGYRDNFVGPVG